VFRPESIRLGPAGSCDNAAEGRIASVSFGGATTVAEIELDGAAGPVAARIRMPSRVGGAAFAPGERVALAWPPDESRLVLA
jgi:hypothetical protein